MTTNEILVLARSHLVWAHQMADQASMMLGGCDPNQVTQREYRHLLTLIEQTKDRADEARKALQRAKGRAEKRRAAGTPRSSEKKGTRG